jgi:hypothetical protein
MTNVYYTYNTLITPGHADIEAPVNGICQVITDTSRIEVHAQTVNVLHITIREAMLIERVTDGTVSDDANVLRTTVYEPGEESNQFL